MSRKLVVSVLLIAGALSFTSASATAVHLAPGSAASGRVGRVLFNLPYANASAFETLDLYLPPRRTTPAPLVIYIHGGGWHTGDKAGISLQYDPSTAPPRPASCTTIVQVQTPDVGMLTAKGFAVAAIDYRLDRKPATALMDAKAAVRFLRAKATLYHLDPHRFAAWGDSAGGYTAIMLGVTSGLKTPFDNPKLGHPHTSSAVEAVVDWFGPTDASNMPGTITQSQIPYTYIRAGRSIPPFSIAHGSADCIVPVQASQDLYQALTAAGAKATLTILPDAGHEDPDFMRTQLQPTLAFLDQTFGIS
ncbi:MAG TPA: alpha/beta hydrolase [Gaiellaceae bacterium]|jgi:acetyl esterase/lipase|nr:alpha/beta hydrolase [Gaiellaceae bacterium]